MLRLVVSCLLLASILLTAAPAWSYDWEYLAMDGIQATCIARDSTHARILVGTYEGFHFMDQASGIWQERDDEGWIGRQVWSLDTSDADPLRVLTGRENAFFKGYIWLTDDLGLTGDLVYESQGGSVTDMDHDGERHYACTWSDVAPGEFLVSDDAGETWQVRGGHGQYAMTSLAYGRSGAVFLAGDAGVARTWDGGLHWEDVSGDLPPGYGIYCLAAHWWTGDAWPEMSLYASNDLGLYHSFGNAIWTQLLPFACRAVAVMPPGAPFLVAAVTFDGRVIVSRFDDFWQWTDETGDLPGTPVDLVFDRHARDLYVVTSQRGVWRAQDVVTDAPAPPAAPRPALAAWPNPFNPRCSLRATLPGAGRAVLDVFDAAGRRVARPLDAVLAAGAVTVAWDAGDLPGGVYLARLRGPGGTASARLVLIK
ncbi:MAG: hypothetical protein JW819_04375 [Candidatus Krumholzibacteriota bacterium]|nr:hypothetical protein [Candidatus Krumholzibacteriota bacterium]